MTWTDRYQEIVKFIVDSTREHGRPPSHREIGDEFDITNQYVGKLLRKMAEDGLIQIRPGEHRSVRVARTSMIEKTERF